MSQRIELTKAVMTQLKASTALTSLVSTYAGAPSIFTHVPQDLGEAYPWLVMYDSPMQTDDTDSGFRFEGTFNIHTWDDSRNIDTIGAMQKAVYDALHYQRLTMTGYYMVVMRQEFDEILRDPDGITLHGVQRFRVILKTTT